MTEVLVHTGQHYDANMSDVFFEELGIPHPAYNLGVGSGNHGEQTGRMLAEIEKVLLRETPDWLMVYGDTNSTLAGVVAASKLHVPVAHVEAGLRSFNRKMPEEINRVLSDHGSDLLFAPTCMAVTHLLREGVSSEKIHQVGDVMYDAALYYGEKARAQSTILQKLGLTAKRYVLVTIHRAENTARPERMRQIFEALDRLAEDLSVVLPLHPRTRAILERENINPRHIRLIDPVGYLDMIMLEQQAKLIATDSGGVQKEAFFYRVPCLTLRGETEWVELVELGWNRLVTAFETEAILNDVKSLFEQGGGKEGSPYGDGRSSKAIVRNLQQHGLK